MIQTAYLLNVTQIQPGTPTWLVMNNLGHIIQFEAYLSKVYIIFTFNMFFEDTINLVYFTFLNV